MLQKTEFLQSSVEEVLEKADFVSIHCPGGESTYHLMNKERIGMMKKGAYLINSARGDVIDNDALIEALKNKTIAGAGIDVYEHEPLSESHKLRFLPNAFLTPHIGYVTQENYLGLSRSRLSSLGLHRWRAF